MSRTISRSFPGLLAALLLIGCSRSPDDPEVVARLPDGQAVTRSELAAWKAELPPVRTRRHPEETDEAHSQRMLEQLVVDRLLDQHLDGWTDDLPDEVELQVEIELEGLLQARVEQLLAVPRIAVTPEEARSHYDKNPELFGHQGRVRLRHIYRRVDRDAADTERQAARREMERLRRRILDGASFEDLARERSDSETAVHGGLIGVLDRGVLEEPLDSLVWSLEEGEVSRVVPTPVGFHIFRLDTRIPPNRTAYEEAEQRIYRRLERLKTERVKGELLEQLLEASGGELHLSRLESEDDEALLFAVDEERLTLGEWRRRLGAMSFFEARERPEAELLADWALGRLYLWEARRRGLEETPEIARALDGARRTLLAEWIREDVRREALDSIGNEVLRGYYEEAKARFQTPRLVDLSILFERFPEDREAWYGVYEDLVELAAAIRAGEVDFAAAAQRRSDDFSAAEGGRIGPTRMDAFQEWAGPPAQAAVLELEPGQVSDPILVERYVEPRLSYDRDGYLLAVVHRVIEPTTPSFAEARERVVERLVRAAPPPIEAAIRDSILASSGAELFPENLP